MKSQKDDKYFVPTYMRSGAPMVKGKGAYIFDTDGKKYLDFGTGIAVTALGHNHPEIVSELKKQGSMLLHASNLYFIKTQIDFAKLLIKHSFGDKVFLCNSGTEANEAAIKFARKWASIKDPKKYHILSFTDSFHGRTYGALSATAQKKFHNGFKPVTPGFHYGPYNNIIATKKILEKYSFAGIIIEPLQGESGFNSATKEFLSFLRSYSNKHNIVLIFDEIQCGMGRTGTLWHYEQYNIVPDLMTLAKPIGGGLPLGVVICKNKIAGAMEPGDHGTTFGGNPLACALGSVVIKTVAKKLFLKEIRIKGKYLKDALLKLAEKNDSIRGITGAGLMVGVRLKNDPSNIIESCRKKGLLVVKAGYNTVRFMPPLTVTKDEIDKAVGIFKKSSKL